LPLKERFALKTILVYWRLTNFIFKGKIKNQAYSKESGTNTNTEKKIRQ
jgi:hypothetical protein